MTNFPQRSKRRVVVRERDSRFGELRPLGAWRELLLGGATGAGWEGRREPPEGVTGDGRVEYFGACTGAR